MVLYQMPLVLKSYMPWMDFLTHFVAQMLCQHQDSCLQEFFLPYILFRFLLFWVVLDLHN